MATVSWRRDHFRITRHPVNREMFDAWVDGEGRPALREALRNTRNRWFFGNRRARYRLYRSARATFRPASAFSATTRKKLDQLPMVIRSNGLALQGAGHRTLCTFDKTTSLAVIPRGLVLAEFKASLLRELVGLPQVGAFRGLTERVVAVLAAEAETQFFRYVGKGRTHVDETGRGIVFDVDHDFRWKLNGLDGHYYYACSFDQSTDLTIGRERRRFMAGIKEMFQAQTVYLRRMRPNEIAETSEAFRIRRTLGPRRTTSGRMNPRRREEQGNLLTIV